MGVVPRGSEARVTAPLRPPLLAALEQRKDGGGGRSSEAQE